MIVEMFKKRGNGMSLEQFRAWLMTPDGQELLAEINQQGANARYLEQAG